jgi:hypothetical protein
LYMIADSFAIIHSVPYGNFRRLKYGESANVMKNDIMYS